MLGAAFVVGMLLQYAENFQPRQSCMLLEAFPMTICAHAQRE